MEHRLALMQDSLLCKADLGAGGRRYVPTPLLQELKRMVDSRGAQACGE